MQWKVDFVWQPVTISSVFRPRRSSKALPKAKFSPKMVYLVVCCLSDPLKVSESQRKHYMWEVRSASGRDALRTAVPAASSGQLEGPVLLQTTPDHTSHDKCFKSSRNWVTEVSPHPLYAPDLSPTDCHFFKCISNFLRGRYFHNQQETENAFQEFSESRGMDFYEETNLFIVGKPVLTVMVHILINEDVFAPRYNDLKFRVQNCNYFCTNLVNTYPHLTDFLTGKY